MLQVLKKDSDAEWITGGTIFFDDQMRIWKARIGTGMTRWMYRWVDPTVIGGPSAFFSLSRLREVGGFNVELHYTMDGDLWNKFFAAGMRIHHLKRYLWGFRMHPASKTAHALVGPKNSEFNAEDGVVFSRRRFSAKQKRLAIRMLRCVKLLNGSLFRSFYDTKRWRNDSILTLMKITDS